MAEKQVQSAGQAQEVVQESSLLDQVVAATGDAEFATRT